MDISILCEQFCDHSITFLGISPQTIRKYKFVLGGFVKFTGIHDLNNVTEEKVHALFYYGRTERKWSAQTYIVYYQTLTVFFRWCVRMGYMPLSPVQNIEVPKVEKKLPVKLTQQSAMRLMEIAYNYPYGNSFTRCRNHAIFATFIFAGLRKQELLNLKYTDIDLNNLTLFVRLGKGNKDRIIPINHGLAQSLKRYLSERAKLHRTCPEFFTSACKNQGYTASGLKRLVESMNKAMGMRFSVHKLRHTFATLMLEGGCDIYSLSRLMGHSDIKTKTIYLSATAELLRAQMIKHPLSASAPRYQSIDTDQP